MKAMLLAAGYGERMLPITRVVPKPLIPVLGRPIAPQILSRLGAEGIDETVINLHHLPQPLRNMLGDGTAFGLRALHYSLEEKQLLGTAGGLAQAAGLLKGAGTILVRNSDFLADIPLAQVVASHIRSGCPATIVLAPHRAGYTPVTINEHRRVTGFGGKTGGGYLFTGYQLIEESVLELIPKDAPSDIVRDVYFGLAAVGRLNAYVHDGFWWEFGDPRAYLEGSMQVVALPAEHRVHLGDFDVVHRLGDALAAIGPGADVSAPAIEFVGTLAIGMGVMIGERANLEDTVVMPEAWVGPGSILKRCIVGPGTEIPVNFIASESLIVADPDPAAPLTRGVDRVAGLLVRRFSESAVR
jgi:NDP-sugar pyrophosphorylase family protein